MATGDAQESRGLPVTLRTVEAGDLALFFEQQLDPEANWLAAFVAKDPKDRAAFDAHWARILKAPGITNRTILEGAAVAGHVACFPQDGALEVTYWLGHDYWGRGIATQALQALLRLIPERPLRARVAKDNPASLRVLQKCGFTVVGTDRGYANGRGQEIEEFILQLS
jgi:RimJ/RimL family protein N-acetyltransferase